MKYSRYCTIVHQKALYKLKYRRIKFLIILSCILHAMQMISILMYGGPDMSCGPNNKNNDTEAFFKCPNLLKLIYETPDVYTSHCLSFRGV